MKKLIFAIFYLAFFASCSPNSADRDEYNKYCRGDDCYLQFEKTDKKQDPCSGAWASSTDCGSQPPGSGSDKPLFGGGSNSSSDDEDDIPENVGCLGPCDAQGTGTTGGTGGDNGAGKDGGEGGGGGGDGKNNEIRKIGREINKGFNNVAGAFNGSNNKKRRKAREARRLQRDAEDVLQQAKDYGNEIETESGLIDSLSRELLNTQAGFEKDASDAALQGIRDRYNGRTQGILDKTPNIDEQTLGNVRGQGVYYEAGKIASGRKYLSYARERVEGYKGQADYENRKSLLDAADGAMDASEEAYKEGSPTEGSAYYQLAIAVADITLSVTPIVGLGKDIIEAAWGRSVLDGHSLTTFERSMAVVGVATLGLGKLGVFGKIGKLGKILGRAAKGGDEAANVAKAAERAETVIAAAERTGIKDKKIIDEIAEVVKDGMPCKVAILSPLDRLLNILVDTAYAADCLPSSVEKRIAELLDNGTKEGIPGDTLGRVQTRINIRNGSPDQVGSGFEYAMKGHGGAGPASKSQFTVPREKIKEVLERKDLVSSPVIKSTDSGNFVRQFDTGETIGRLPINKGADPTSVITVITDDAGNLVNTFPGTLGRGAQLN